MALVANIRRSTMLAGRKSYYILCISLVTSVGEEASHKVKATVENTANIIQTCYGCMRRHKSVEMLYESNGILLLLTRGVDVGKEEWDVVPANQCHESCIVKPVHVSLLLAFICSLMRLFTLVYRFTGDLGLVLFGRFLAQGLDTATNGVNLFLR